MVEEFVERLAVWNFAVLRLKLPRFVNASIGTSQSVVGIVDGKHNRYGKHVAKPFV